MVLPQLSVRQANRQTRGTSLHAAQWIMVNKDKYPRTTGSNPAQDIAVVKCHIQPSLSFINHIHQLQPSSPPLDSPFHSSVYPPSLPSPILTSIFLFPLLGKKTESHFRALPSHYSSPSDACTLPPYLVPSTFTYLTTSFSLN